MAKVIVPNVVGSDRLTAEADLDAVPLRHIAVFAFGADGDGRSTQQFPPEGAVVEAFSVVTVIYPSPLGPLPDSPVEGPEPPVQPTVPIVSVIPAAFVREGSLLGLIERSDGLPFNLPLIPTRIVMGSRLAPIVFVDQDSRIYFSPPDGSDAGEGATFTSAFLEDTGEIFDFAAPVFYAEQLADKISSVQDQSGLLSAFRRAVVDFERVFNINVDPALVRSFYSLISGDAVLILADIVEAIDRSILPTDRPAFRDQVSSLSDTLRDASTQLESILFP